MARVTPSHSAFQGKILVSDVVYSRRVMKHPLKNSMAIAMVLMAAVCGLGSDAKERIIKFPEKTSIGKLYSFPKKESLIGTVNDTFFADAIGTVRVPDGQRTLLKGDYILRDDLKPLLRLKADDIDYLNLSKLPITDAQVKNLRHLTGLQRLDLEGADISDEALKDIGMLKHLKVLCVSKTLINGSGFKYLAGLSELEELQTGNNNLKDSNVAYLLPLKRLRVLRLGATQIGEEAAKYVGKLQALESVRLANNNRINDRAVSHLVGLGNLDGLNLRDTGVTIAALESLIKMKKLRHLELSERFFNKRQMKLLRQELPKCRIKFGTGSKVSPDLFAPLH